MNEKNSKVVIGQEKTRKLIDLLNLPSTSRDKQTLKEIGSCIKNIPFFQIYYNKPEFQYLCQALQVESYSSGQVIFSQGQTADKFYLLLEGTIGLYVKNNDDDLALELNNENRITDFEQIKQVAKVEEGEGFGELGLLYNVKRTATAASLIYSKLAFLEKEVFQKYFKKLQNEKINIMLDFFQNIKFFQDIPFDQILRLTTKCNITKCDTNTLIIGQDEIPKGIFFVRSGLIKVIKQLSFQEKNGKLTYENPMRDTKQKKRNIEIDELGKDTIFCGKELYNQTQVSYSLITSTFSEIILMTADIIQQFLSNEQFQNLAQSSQHYPSETTIKEHYLQKTQWEKRKHKILNELGQKTVMLGQLPNIQSKRKISDVDMISVKKRKTSVAVMPNQRKLKQNQMKELEDKYISLSFPKIKERILKSSHVKNIIKLERKLNNEEEFEESKQIRPIRSYSMDIRKILTKVT